MSKQPAKKAPAAPKTITHNIVLNLQGNDLVASGAGQEARVKLPAAKAITVHIIIERTSPAHGYWPGPEAVEVPAEQAAALIAGGFARKA